jgi:hypothetical protein
MYLGRDGVYLRSLNLLPPEVPRSLRALQYLLPENKEALKRWQTYPLFDIQNGVRLKVILEFL